MIVYFVFCIMDSIQGMRLIQILFFLSSLFSVWPQALFTEWHPSLAWNKMGFCFWIFCGTHQYSLWISQQSYWINPHNVPSDVWNYFNSSLMKIMREIMWFFLWPHREPVSKIYSFWGVLSISWTHLTEGTLQEFLLFIRSAAHL